MVTRLLSFFPGRTAPDLAKQLRWAEAPMFWTTQIRQRCEET